MIKYNARTSTQLALDGRDPSRLPIAELRRIANDKGYDTLGMDRTALEAIARGWAAIVRTRPNQQERDRIGNIGGVIDVEQSSYDYGSPNSPQPASRYTQPMNNQQNRQSSIYGQSSPYGQSQNSGGSYTSQGNYNSGQTPRFVDTQPGQYVSQRGREDMQQQRPSIPPPPPPPPPPPQSQRQKKGPFAFFGGRGRQEQSYDNNQMNFNQSSNQFGGYGRRNPWEDSIRAALAGFFGGGFAVLPITYLHNYEFPSEIITNQMSQWYFDTFTGAISAAAFACVYRYFVKERKDDLLVSFLLLDGYFFLPSNALSF